MRHVLVGLILLLAGLAPAADERELAFDGKAVRLSIDKAYRCDQSATVTITTASAAYFDQDAATIQRLSDTARAILSFECPRIARIEFVGVAAGVPVYRADAEKANRWRLESLPAPLEGAALLFSTKPPSLRNLGVLASQIKPFENVPGLRQTYQYQAWETQMRVQARAAGDNLEAFTDYLKEPGGDLGTFEQARAHFEDILSALKTFVPERHAAFRTAFDAFAPSLRQAYWASQFDSLFDDEYGVASVIGKANKLIAAAPSPEFTAYLDAAIAEWMRDEANDIKADLPEGTLEDVSSATEFLSGFNAGSDSTKLPRSAALITSIHGELGPLVAQRLAALQSLAIATIREAGETYADADDIVEAGFALAGEFEEAGFAAQGEAVLSAAFEHVDTVLQRGLPAYKADLESMTFTAASAAALQEQIGTFEELSQEFQGFGAYKEVAQRALDANKSTICASVLVQAGISRQDGERLVQVGKKSVTLAQMSCDMFTNGHTLSAFARGQKGNDHQVTVRQEDGEEVTHVLAQQGRLLVATARLDGKAVTPDSWESYAQGLMRPPADGKPDAKGVRDCDRFAADPHDSKKLGKGVDFDQPNFSTADFDRAIEACIAAIDDAPDDHRQQFQLGRVLFLSGDSEGATEYLDLAITGGYGAAMYHKGEVQMMRTDDQNAFVDALELFAAAGKAGYARGAAMVKQLNPDGIAFFRQIPGPTAPEILAAFPSRGGNSSFLGVNASVEVVNVAIKECFQMNATDFACEYRPVIQCAMSSARPDPVIAFMSRVMQADCNSADMTFGSFRKATQGRWEKLPE